MKRHAAVLLCVFLLMTGLIGVGQLPREAQAAGAYNTREDLGPGNYANMTTWIPANGTLLTWSYSTTSNFEFWMFGPSGVVDHHFPGTEGSTYGNGEWVTTPGNYSFVWRNHELSSRATIDYAVNYCVPISATLTSPQASVINNKLNLEASGKMDGNASKLSYSLNNITYHPVTKGYDPGTWIADLNLSSGVNILFLATEYGAGNFSYTDYQMFPIMTGFGLDFIPTLELTRSITNQSSLNTTLYGTCDANASAVFVSLDNQTFEKATKGSSIWQSNLTLKSGSNIIYLREDFNRGDFSYHHNSQASINVDSVGQSQGSDDSMMGVVLLVIGLAMFIAIAYIAFKKKK
jgi:hypothetical protein